MMVYLSIFMFVFVIVLGIIVILNIKNNKISHNIAEIKTKLLSKADLGDEFADIFYISELYEDTKLHIRYSFLKRFDYEKKLIIGVSEEKFWKTYEKEKELFKKDPNYRLYKLFINNIGYKGDLIEENGVIKLTIKKESPLDRAFIHCNSLTSVTFPNLNVGSSSALNMTYGGLYCSAFEKIRMIWHNSIENDDDFSFIIKDVEVEDFCNMCQLMCGEELIC